MRVLPPFLDLLVVGMLGCHLVGEASEIRFKGQDGVLEGQLLVIEGVQAAES